MPRKPDQTDATGMWDVTHPNQQRDAIYGEKWPLPALAPPPAWAGNRYFSYCGYDGQNVLSYEYNNSRTLASGWSTSGVGNMFTHMSYAYTGKMSNQTRFVQAGGLHGGSNYSNILQYVTCASLGSSAWFGDADYSSNSARGGSDGTLGVYAGGSVSSGNSGGTNTKKFITIATTGNGSNYGQLTGKRQRAGSASGATYFTMFGGQGNGPTTEWEYVAFSSGSNGTTAGDLETAGYVRYNYDCDAIDNNTSRLVLAGGAWQFGGHGDAMFHYNTSTWGAGTDYANMANAREANSTTGDGISGVIAGGQGAQAYSTGTLIFTIDTLAAAVVGMNSLSSGVTRNGMAAGNQ